MSDQGSPNATPPAVLLENVSYSYNGAPAVQDANLKISENEFVSVVGPNAGGKTTLLKLVLGLLSPNRGTVRVFGRSPQEICSRIGYVPQYANLDRLFPVTVMDVVLMGRLGRKTLLGPYRKSDRRAAEEALRSVGLFEFRRNSLFSLSGGQQQRALIARALASRPDLLLLDEPTASLDLVFEKELYELLEKLNENMTILLVSHDLAFVTRLVEKVVCVNRRVVIHPTSELTGETIREVYGGDLRMVRHDHREGSGIHDGHT
jgi:zinc transport system ATP-binding protein